MNTDVTPTVLVECPACHTQREVPADEWQATVAEHNERAHGGYHTARLKRAILPDERLVTDGGVTERAEQATPHVDADCGLWLPPEIREFDKQIVFRTPKGTIQHFGSDDLGPYYGMIDENSFGDVEDFRDPKNPELAPNQVSIKKQGEEAIVFEVECVVDDLGERRAL